MMLASSACTPSRGPETVDAVASRYIRLTRELARHEPSLVDHWLREPPPLDGPRRPVPELAREIEALTADAGRLVAQGPDGDRVAHLARQARALHLAASRLLGESPSFDEEARLGLALGPVEFDGPAAEQARAALDQEIPGPGPLAERVRRFRERFVVAPIAREAVMRAALEQCRAATIPSLALPSDEAIELAFVDGLPWDAHARYLGRHRTRVDVNASRPLDLARALRLACHEGYPGHHTQYLWLDDEVLGRRQWHEFALVAGFGPDLLAAEGLAEAGADLAMPAPRRLDVYRNHLAPAAGLNGADLDRLVRVEDHLATLEPVIGDIARDYLDNRLNAAGAAERLTNEALIAEADGFVSFIERRRSRLLAYAEGRRLALARAGRDGLAALPGLLVTGLAP